MHLIFPKIKLSHLVGDSLLQRRQFHIIAEMLRQEFFIFFKNHKCVVLKGNLGILPEKRGSLHLPWNAIPAAKIRSSISLLFIQPVWIVYDSIAKPFLGYPEETYLHCLGNKSFKFGCSVMISILHGIEDNAEVQKVKIYLCQQCAVIIIVIGQNIHQDAIIFCIIWMLDVSISCPIEHNL